jgi:hypothetical protein
LAALTGMLIIKNLGMVFDNNCFVQDWAFIEYRSRKSLSGSREI